LPISVRVPYKNAMCAKHITFTSLQQNAVHFMLHNAGLSYAP